MTLLYAKGCSQRLHSLLMYGWQVFLKGGFARQLIQGKIADMYTVTAATRAFVYKTAAEADAGMANRKDCAAVILYAAEHATRMALDAIQVSASSQQVYQHTSWASFGQ